MPFNSNSFTLSSTTTETAFNLPSRTASILVRASSANTDFVNVRLGGGSPLRLNAGDVISFDIERTCLYYSLKDQEPPATIFITNATTQSNAGIQTIFIIAQEWRLR